MSVLIHSHIFGDPCTPVCPAFRAPVTAGFPPSLDDPVNHPKHYNAHPSGVECIDIIEHMPFNIGSAIKYLWRAGLKSEALLFQDLEKAQWYIAREIGRLKKDANLHSGTD